MLAGQEMARWIWRSPSTLALRPSAMRSTSSICSASSDAPASSWPLIRIRERNCTAARGTRFDAWVRKTLKETPLRRETKQVLTRGAHRRYRNPASVPAPSLQVFRTGQICCDHHKNSGLAIFWTKITSFYLYPDQGRKKLAGSLSLHRVTESSQNACYTYGNSDWLGTSGLPVTTMKCSGGGPTCH